MSSNRYFQISQGVPMVEPLQIDFGLAAESLLRKQKVYDDTAAGMQPYADAVLKTQAIAPDDVSYVKQKSAEVSGLMDSYLNQDLTDPHVQRKLTKDFRGIASDPHLSLIDRNTKDYIKSSEELEKLSREGKAPRDYNRGDFDLSTRAWLTPGSGGSTKFQTGLPTYYGNADKQGEANKLFQSVGADKWSNVQYDAQSGTWWNVGGGGKSATKLDATAVRGLEAYLQNTEFDYKNQFKYLSPEEQQKYGNYKTYALNDLVQLGRNWQTQSSERSFDKGLTDWGAEEALRNTNRTDIIPVDVKTPELGTIDTKLSTKLVNTATVSRDGRIIQTSINVDNLSPAEQTAHYQTVINNFTEDEKKAFERITKSTTGTITDKVKAFNEYSQWKDQLPTMGYTRSSKVFFGDQILDVDIEKDQGILKNMLGRRIGTQKVYNIKTGEEVTDQDIKTKMTQAVNKGEAIPTGQIGSDSGMGNFMDKTTKGGTSYRFAEAPIFNYEGEEYVIENNEEFYTTPEGRTAVNVWRNSSNLKEYPKIFSPVVTSAGEEIDAKLQAKYNTDDTYTIKGMKLGNWLYDDEGNANPDISATPDGYKVSPKLFYEIAANIEGVDVKAALKRLSFK